MAPGRRLVQRVRHVRRVGVQFEHHAHVLHIAGQISGHTTSASDPAPLFHYEVGVL